MSDAGEAPLTRPFESLLDVQRLDTALAQLHHRRGHLPEQVALQELRAGQSAREAELGPVTEQAAQLDARSRALESEAQAVEAKIGEAERRLFSGTISAPRELQALEADIASLKRRRSELEDQQLEILIEREPVDAASSAAAARAADDAAEAQRLLAAISEAEAAIDTEAAALTAQRRTHAAEIEPGLLADYERVRAKNNGVGAARLEHGTCMSCRLKLSAVELDRLRREPSGVVVHCDECGAILVR